jgi:hypothetical protein
MAKLSLAFAAVGAALSLGARPAAAQMMKMEAPASKQRTLTGTVIDVSCKFGQGLSGAEHKMCSEICADRGLPLAILGEDGKLYLATSSGMPGEGQNARLKAFAEQKVTVSGKVFAAGGASAIQIDKIQAAN